MPLRERKKEREDVKEETKHLNKCYCRNKEKKIFKDVCFCSAYTKQLPTPIGESYSYFVGIETSNYLIN